MPGRKFSWKEFNGAKKTFLESYISEARQFSDKIRENYKELNRDNVTDFHNFTDSTYTRLGELLNRAYEAGELEQPEYDEICTVLTMGKQKCEEKVAAVNKLE